MQMQKFGWNKNSFLGLVIYLVIGGLTFVVDVSVIFILYQLLDVLRPVAVGAGFVVGAFFNYGMNRKLVYANSSQPHTTAMVWFFGIAFVWLWFTVAGTEFLVRDVGIPLYVSRSLVGMFVAVAGYVLNSLFTFRMSVETKPPTPHSEDK